MSDFEATEYPGALPQEVWDQVTGYDYSPSELIGTMAVMRNALTDIADGPLEAMAAVLNMGPSGAKIACGIIHNDFGEATLPDGTLIQDKISDILWVGTEAAQLARWLESNH